MRRHMSVKGIILIKNNCTMAAIKPVGLSADTTSLLIVFSIGVAQLKRPHLGKLVPVIVVVQGENNFSLGLSLRFGCLRYSLGTGKHGEGRVPFQNWDMSQHAGAPKLGIRAPLQPQPLRRKDPH